MNFVSVLQNYEVFNRLNNTEPLIPIQIFKNCVPKEEHQLRNGIVLRFSDLNSNYLESITDRLLPFLSKGSFNYRKITRRFLITFDCSDVDERSNVLQLFLDFFLSKNGKFLSPQLEFTPETDEQEEQEESERLGECNELRGESFKLYFYVMQSPFEEFFSKYRSCFALFEWSKFIAIGKVYNDYYASEIVESFLFLGDYVNATNKDQLKALQITHIVDASNDDLSKAVSEELEIEYFPVPVWDTEDSNLSQYFDHVNEFIQNARLMGDSSRVLVHCRAGWSRSPSLIVAFLIGVLNFSLTDSLIMVVKQRPMVCPNPGFRRQLMNYEAQHLKIASFANDTDCLDIIRQYSKMWSHSTVSESDFDRIPIQALKSNFSYTLDTESVQSEQKAKKPFLKRGEGRNIHKDIKNEKKFKFVKRTASENQNQNQNPV